MTSRSQPVLASKGQTEAVNTAAFVHPVDQLEPGALTSSALVPPMQSHVIDELRIQLSIAISLKRIADTMDGTAAGLCVTETIFGRARQ